MADINSTLLKIKSLADGTPYAHEREVTLGKLHKLMEKLGITEQDLNDELVSTHDFKFRNKREKLLLNQILYKVFGSLDWVDYSYIRGKRIISNIIGIECTKAQKIEIDFLFDFYKRLYKKEEQSFYEAFVQKHNLFGTPDDRAGKTLKPEESMKRKKMMSGMENATPYKQIEEKNKK